MARVRVLCSASRIVVASWTPISSFLVDSSVEFTAGQVALSDQLREPEHQNTITEIKENKTTKFKNAHKLLVSAHSDSLKRFLASQLTGTHVPAG